MPSPQDNGNAGGGEDAMDGGAQTETQPRPAGSSNSELSPRGEGGQTAQPPQRVHPKEGYASATRATARLLVGTTLLLAVISTLAQLAGCHVTRQWPGAKASQPPPATMQPASCRQWDECA